MVVQNCYAENYGNHKFFRVFCKSHPTGYPAFLMTRPYYRKNILKKDSQNLLDSRLSGRVSTPYDNETIAVNVFNKTFKFILLLPGVYGDVRTIRVRFSRASSKVG